MQLAQDDLIPFDFSVQVYDQQGTIEVSENCNAILALNIAGVGGALATINKFPINAALVAGANGESFVIGGHPGEIINRLTIDLAFPNGGNGLVLILQKFYLVRTKKC